AFAQALTCRRPFPNLEPFAGWYGIGDILTILIPVGPHRALATPFRFVLQNLEIGFAHPESAIVKRLVIRTDYAYQALARFDDYRRGFLAMRVRSIFYAQK